jgi:hypothetical protein
MSKVSCQVCGDYTNNEPAICGDCLAEGATHVNEPRIFDSSPIPDEARPGPRITEISPDHAVADMSNVTIGMAPKVEETAQDRGEPSPVPYIIFIKSPAVDTEEPGIERLNVSLALKSLDLWDIKHCVPPSCQPFVEMADNAFRRGYYRFELVVGDLSIRIYKHPNNP